MAKSKVKPYPFNEVILSGIVGSLVQVGLTSLLTCITNVNMLHAILYVFPLTIVIVFLFVYVLAKSNKYVEDSDVLSEVGFHSAIPKLKDSEYTPEGCMRLAQSTLYFMGTTGSKWVLTTNVRENFKSFLHSIEGKKGKVKFLLIKPDSGAYRRLKSRRRDALTGSTYEMWKKLSQEFECLEVKVFNHLPCFRTIFIDNSKMVLSRYKLEKNDHIACNSGWDAPHLIFRQKAEWAMYDAFRLYWDEEWRAARDI